MQLIIEVYKYSPAKLVDLSMNAKLNLYVKKNSFFNIKIMNINWFFYIYLHKARTYKII